VEFCWEVLLIRRFMVLSDFCVFLVKFWSWFSVCVEMLVDYDVLCQVCTKTVDFSRVYRRL